MGKVIMGLSEEQFQERLDYIAACENLAELRQIARTALFRARSAEALVEMHQQTQRSNLFKSGGIHDA